jgi:hypothetical protein
MYRPTYQCPQKANSNTATQISKLSALSATLDEVLTELIDRQNPTKYQPLDNNDSEHDQKSESSSSMEVHEIKKASVNDGSIDGEDEIISIFDEQCKRLIMTSLEEAHANITWQKESIANQYSSPSTTATVSSPKEMIEHHTIKEPPAALLRGKLKYYNRINGQWRIVLSDAVLRPRMNIDYRKKNNKRNCTSLWDQSIMSLRKECELKRSRNVFNPDQLKEEFPQDDTGGILLDGDLVILAYDDVS